MIGVCKFCGCTEDAPCFLGLQGPCAWLLEDVCTNPECVEKAYYEARDFVMQLFLEEIAA
jgi:hypothetical protein